MSFDLEALRDATSRHGRVARVVVAEISGSTPREAGAAMLVWRDGQSGTIGGGRLELDAADAARAALDSRTSTLRKVPLGPSIGQCCGGSVTLASEVFDYGTAQALTADRAGCIVRNIGKHGQSTPLAVDRNLAQIRNGTTRAAVTLLGTWLIEPVSQPSHSLWVHGAGHVGRAIVRVMAPLERWTVTWVDTHEDRFPIGLPHGVEKLVACDPARAASHAPGDAHHLILTYSHALDLEICHALLDRGFASAGLIGSSTKWSRFRKRLRQLGHSNASISRIACPIGDPTLGKEPQAIAIGVTALLLRETTARDLSAMDRPA